MPVPESLGMFVTKLRKRLSSSTVDTFTLNRVYVMAVVEMVRAYGYEEAMRKIFEWGYAMGHAYLLRLESELEHFDMSPASIKLLGRSAWYMFSGNDVETHVETREVDGKKIIIFRLRDPESPWDKGFKLGKKVAYYPAGAYEGASAVYALIVGKGNWMTFARNTKSLAAGDPYTEIVNVYVEKGLPREVVERELKDFFDDIISYDYSLELYKKIVAPG